MKKAKAVPPHLLSTEELDEKTPELEIEHVHNLYDTVALQWDGTR